MLMVLAGSGAIRQQERDWTVTSTGTRSRPHMQSDGDSLVRADAESTLCSLLFYDACHLVSLQTSGSCRCEARRLDRWDGPVIGKATAPTAKAVAPPSAIRAGSG